MSGRAQSRPLFKIPLDCARGDKLITSFIWRINMEKFKTLKSQAIPLAIENIPTRLFLLGF